MNNFVAKKVAEVLAFEKIGLDTIEKAGMPLIELVGQETIVEWKEAHHMRRDSLSKIADRTEGSHSDEIKSKEAENKIEAMGTIYIKDQWSNPTEVLEWLGFLAGASMAHWLLIKGAASTEDNQDLIDLADESITFYHHFLDHIGNELESIGEDQA